MTTLEYAALLALCAAWVAGQTMLIQFGVNRLLDALGRRWNLDAEEFKL